MECSICGIRGSVDTCPECRALLCEVCAVACHHCGKLSCPQHTYKTSHGHDYCVNCAEEARAKRGQGAVAHVAEEEEEPERMETLEERVLTSSARKPPAAWKLSLYTALTALVVVVIMLIFPSVRRIEYGAGHSFPAPYLLLILCALAIFWAVRGFLVPEDDADRNRSFFGLALSVVAGVLVFVAVFTDPMRMQQMNSVEAQSERDNMSEEQLREWRRERLMNRFGRPDGGQADTGGAGQAPPSE